MSFLPISNAQAVEQRVVDVVAISWVGASEIQDKFVEVAGSIDRIVGPQWLAFTSLAGDIRDKKIQFYKGLELASPILMSTPMPCTGFQASFFTDDVRKEAYRRLGVTDYADRYLIIVAPKAGCIWQGRAMVGKPGEKGGVLTLHDNASSFVIVHELGHSLGLGHSNLLQCDGQARDGSWGRECRAVEYGGAIDVMSNVETTSPLSIYHQWRMGLLEKEEIKTAWRSEEIELKPSTSYGAIRAVFIKDGNASYWIEYRKAMPDNKYKSGLIVYRTDPPPASAIISPNPEDTTGAIFDSSVTTDFWMMNLGDYQYSSGRASGSMTLGESSSVKLASGNVELTVTKISDYSLTLKVNRKADTTPPPRPVIIPPINWSSPSSPVINGEYDDLDSTIDFFEIERDGVVSKISVGSLASWTPTYLNPLEPRKNLLLSDLPEGDYDLRVRGVDIWGNASLWSSVEKVLIDRGSPLVTSETKVLAADSKILQVQWNGAKDEGIGLCETNRSTNEGWVLTQSKEKSNPVISVPLGKSLTSNFQVVDCRGNGITGKLTTNAKFMSAATARKTGQWESIKSPFIGALKCVGKCTITFGANGNLVILAGQGTAAVLVSSKRVQVINNSESDLVRNVGTLNLGKSKKVVRIQGRNFTIHGTLNLEFLLSAVSQENFVNRTLDVSLQSNEQKELAKYGFSGDDFESSWKVLPMPRGTTLLDPTLDLCEFEYQSDRERSSRRQVSVSKVGSPYSFLSTEVVRYRDTKAAQSALLELKANLRKCITEGGGFNQSGSKTVYQFSPVALPRYEGMTSDDNGVFIHAIVGSGSQARALLAFYQFNGDLLSGLYVISNQTTYFSASTIEHWSQVAAALGTRLMNKSLT